MRKSQRLDRIQFKETPLSMPVLFQSSSSTQIIHCPSIVSSVGLLLCSGKANSALAKIVDGVPFSEESISEDSQWAL